LDGSPASNGSITITNVEGGVGGYTFAWSDTSLTTSSRPNLPAGTYTVTVQDANGCELVNTTILEGEEVINTRMGIVPIPNNVGLPVRYDIEDTTICYLSRWHLYVNYQEGYYIEWTPEIYLDYPELTENADSVSITACETGQIIVYVTTDRCMDYDLIEFSFFDTLGAYIYSDPNLRRDGDTIYAPLGQPLTLWIQESYLSFEWFGTGPFSTTNEALTTLTPAEDQVVSFRGSTPDGCIETDYVYVIILKPIEVYDVFTPNDDGYNDYWEIRNAFQYTNLEVFIFDRWGQQVFYSKPYGTSMHHVFEGKSQKNGKDLPIGTYYYIIKPNDGEQEPFTGTVTIIR